MRLLAPLGWLLDWRRRHPRAFNATYITFGLAVSSALGYSAVRGLDLGAIAKAFREVSLLSTLSALAIFLASNVARAYRWRVLFVAERVPTWRLFIIQNVGIGLNNLMPIRVFSEPTQFAILTLRDRVSGGVALATLGMERVLDMVASTALLAVGLVLLPQMGGLVGFGPQLGFAVLLSLIWVGAAQFLAWGSGHLAFFKRVPLLYSFGASIAELERHWLRLTLSFLVTVAYWVLIGVSAWVLAIGMGLDLSLTMAVVMVVVVTFFATSVPSAPGAVGAFEGAVVFMLVSFFGLPKDKALAFGVLLHAILYVPSVLIALALLPREAPQAVKQVRQQKTGEPPKVVP